MFWSEHPIGFMEEAREYPRAAPGALTAIGYNGMAGVTVLTNRALLELITGFLIGYPYIVHKFCKEVDRTRLPMPLADSNEVRRLNATQRIISSLPHRAIAASDLQVFLALYRLSKEPHFKENPKLQFAGVTRFAVLCKSVEILKCIVELNIEILDWGRGETLLHMALEDRDFDVEVLDWIDEMSRISEWDPYLPLYMMTHAERGCYGAVQWIHEHGCVVSKGVIDVAAQNDHTNLLRYFYDHSSANRTSRSKHHGVKNGVLDFDEHDRKMRKFVMNAVARYGQLEAVKLFLEGENEVETSFVINHAARKGHLDIVKYVHKNHPSGCTAMAMSNAAASVVKFLHENCTEGCVPDAISRAARNGHLEAVKFLHKNYRSFKCSTTAMDQAAANGHLEVLEFLHDNRIRTCSPAAMVGAARSGYFDVVKLLYKDCNVIYSARVMEEATRNEHLKAAESLLSIRQAGDSLGDGLRYAAKHGHYEIVKLLYDQDSTQGVPTALQQRRSGIVWRSSSFFTRSFSWSSQRIQQ